MNEQEKNEYDVLKTEILSIRNEYEKVKKIFENVDAFSARFDSIKSSFEDADGNTKSQIDAIENKVKELEVLKKSAQGDVNDISTSIETIGVKIKELDGAYVNFAEIKGKIEGRSSEIDNLLTSAQGLRTDIEVLKTEAQSIIKNIKNLFIDVQAKVKEVQGAYQEFLKIKIKIDDEKTGLSAAFALVQETQASATKLITEIKGFRDEIEEIHNDVKQKQKDTEIFKTEISKYHEFSLQKKEEIQNATNLIIDTSFAETFERRRKDIEDKLYSWKPWLSWKLIFFISIFLLTILILYLAVNRLEGLSGLDLVIARLFYTSPLIVLVTFSATQYSKERDIAEKYAFKAASTAAIRNHIDFLTTNFGTDNPQVVDFVLDTFKIIYKEPYKNEDMKKRMEKIEKNVENLRQDKKHTPLDLKEIKTSLKDIKELLPDENMFR